MASITSAFVRVEPSYTEPNILLQIAQPSGFLRLLADDKIRVMLGEGDLAVYIKRLNLTTSAFGAQSPFTLTAAEFINASFMSTATYHFSNRSVWSRSEEEAAGRWGFSIVQALELAQRQAHFQTARNVCLYGAIPSNGEGLLNTPGAPNVTLPPDSNGNATLRSYDNGEMAQFLLQTIVNMITSMFQAQVPQKISVLGPQRDILYMQQVGIVQLVQFQRSGAGSATTAQMVQSIQEAAGNSIEWNVDDTLIGKGVGGSDAVIVTIPKIKNPQGKSINTNIFAELTPNLDECVLQYSDMAAPRKITSPAPMGMTEQYLAWRMSSGWAPRPQAITILNIPY